MANFRTHLTVGASISLAVAVMGLGAGLYGLSTAVFGAVIGTIGSLLPDIDLRTSRPAKKGFAFAGVFLATLTAILYASHHVGTDAVVNALGVWAVAYVLLKYVIFETFHRVTVHRGMLHSVPYMAVFGLLVVYGSYYGLKLTALVSWLFGLFLFIGALVHLLLDEWYSVNFWGFKLKKSSGTAFKFFESNKLTQYAVLYAILGLLWVFAPEHETAWLKIKQSVMSLIN
ncbi:MAG: metal-dependent hydrolase [Moraxella sp.]|nr:metal-dependent hydrolase [Moraxella sp.]